MRGVGLRAVLNAREGHFRFESGHHGRLWLELDSLFWEPAAVEPLAAALAERLHRHDVQAVVGPLTGGAFLGQRVAALLGAAFAHTERHAHDGEALYSAEYRLPGALARRLAGRRVALVDDVINAGSALRSTRAAVERAGAEPVVAASLVRLGGTAVPHLPEITSLEVWPHELWEPQHCPDCAAGARIEEAQVSG